MPVVKTNKNQTVEEQFPPHNEKPPQGGDLNGGAIEPRDWRPERQTKNFQVWFYHPSHMTIKQKPHLCEQSFSA